MAYRQGLVSDPATHVLIIGVDDYTHLPPQGGGGGPVTRGDVYAPGLTKLSTATPSAEHVAEWFLDPGGFRHPQRPLASLNILVSAGSFRGEAVPRPTFSAIRTAFSEWRDRCHTHEDNNAVLYFCGHGMEESSHYLLPEDIFDDPAAPDENFIELDATIKFMGQCRASTQLYFIDACRTPFPHKLEGIRDNLIQQRREFGRTLIRPQPNPAFFQRHAMEFKSAITRGLPASARVGQETYFAEALVECVRHYGAADDANSGEYWVRIESLREALQERMRRKAIEHAIADLGCSCKVDEIHPTKNPALHLIEPHDVLVQSQVMLLPEVAHQAATIKLIGANTYEHLPAPGPWVDEMVPGLYNVSVSFKHPIVGKPKSPAYLTMPTYDGRWPLR
jgi:hypothetical protein